LLTLSLKVTFQLTLEAFVGSAFARVMDDTVGAVVSQLTVFHETIRVSVLERGLTELFQPYAE
jgi:hypothetical protein